MSREPKHQMELSSPCLWYDIYHCRKSKNINLLNTDHLNHLRIISVQRFASTLDISDCGFPRSHNHDFGPPFCRLTFDRREGSGPQ